MSRDIAGTQTTLLAKMVPLLHPIGVSSMARVVCQCGESFAPLMLNGESRKFCPFCRRELTVGSDGTLAGTKPAPPPPSQTKPPAPVALSQQATGGGTISSPAPPSGIAPAADPPASDISIVDAKVYARPLARFTNTGVLEGALRELARFVETEMRKQKHPLACPHSFGCSPADCSRAFVCGALPRVGSGRGYILAWTLGAAGVMIAFLAIMLTIFALAMPPGEQVREPNYLALVLLLAGFPLGAGLLGFAYSFLSSRWQQGHVRALAAATQKTGLHFLPLVQLPATLADGAFPVICPTPPKFGLLASDARAIVKLAGSGVIDGSEVLLSQYLFHFNPHDHLPFGGAIKVVQSIARPSTTFSRPETWRMYVMTLFPQALPHVPDFLIAPIGRDFETHFVRRQYGSQLISLPNQGHLASYLLAVAEPSGAAMLGTELWELLSREPGWSIQVVGGRLMVWKGGLHPDARFLLPRSAVKLVELIQFASQVRQILRRGTSS